MQRSLSTQERDHLKLIKAQEHLTKLVTRTENTLAAKKNQKHTIVETATKLETEIKTHFWKAIEFLLSEDRRLVKELEEIRDFQLDQVKQDIAAQNKILQLYQGQLRLIDQILESSSDEEVPDVDELCRSAYRKQPRSHPRMLDEIKFECDSEQLLSAIKQVPHQIKVCAVEDPERPAPDFSHTINAGSPKDKDCPDVRNVAVVKVKGIKVMAITDWTNRCVKSFYKIRKKAKEDVFFTGGSPFGIASVDEHVYVTDPTLKKIFQLEVYPSIQTIATISTDKMYCGIASLGETKLVVSGYEWSKSWASFWTVDIMDTNGVIERSIKDRVLQSPEYICTTCTGSIVAADKNSRSLVYLSPEGDEYLTITPNVGNVYRLPQGVAVTRTGEVLLVDSASNKVIEMTDTGEFIRDFMTSEDGLDGPRGICTDQEGYVYVTCRDCVRVYKYK